jgi:tRNA (guanine37-N1)-methyltransferase
MMLRLDFVTLFPEAIQAGLGFSILDRAATQGLASYHCVNPRDFTSDARRTVDDKPFGGSAGMLLMAEPIARALESLPIAEDTAVVFPDPTGRRFVQADAENLAKRQHVVFVCGHYEGIDERIFETFGTHKFSLGDFVLTNGEFPAIIMADAMVRVVPGVLGSSDSLEQDSFGDGLLSSPQYTRPAEWRGRSVPEVLTSGDHERIRKWRRAESLRHTLATRPDLLATAQLSKEDLQLLKSFSDDLD